MPTHKIRQKRHSYLKGNISKGFVSIYSARTILKIAGGLLGLFLPIFLYELLDYNLRYVIFYYLASYTLYLFFIAYGAKYLNKIGLKKSLRISIVWGALFYFIFYLLDITNFGNFNTNWRIIVFLLSVSLLVLTIHRIMYWVPVHTDMAKFTSKTDRGKELSILESTSVLFSALMPLLAGFILVKYNYDVLFFIAILLYFVSLIPLIYLPRTREKFTWTYLQTWKELFSKKRRKAFWAFMGDGAEATVRIIIWPIFIWKIVDGNYLTIGAITSIVVVITIILQLIIGKVLDLSSKEKMLKFGTLMYSAGWLAKIFIESSFQIFIVSTYHGLTNIFTRTPFDVLIYEKASDEGHFVDEYTVIHEMALMVGKIITLFLILLLLMFFSLRWVFVIAAIATLVMNFISRS